MGQRADTTSHPSRERLRELLGGDPDVGRYIADLKRTHGCHALPIDEARKVIDRAMGGRTLTESLYSMRNEDVM